MKLIHLSREAMKKFRSDVPFFVFSITDPDDEDAEFSNENLIGSIRMRFHDIDDFHLRKIRENPMDLQPWIPFDQKDAELVCSTLRSIVSNFMAEARDNGFETVDIVCHCEAGVSRSAGMAAAISKILFDDDSQFFESKGMYSQTTIPNMRVYRMILEEWHK